MTGDGDSADAVSICFPGKVRNKLMTENATNDDYDLSPSFSLMSTDLSLYFVFSSRQWQHPVMFHLIPRVLAHARRQPLRAVSANCVSETQRCSSSSSSSSSPPPPGPNALDQSILELSSAGKDHLPQLFQDVIESEVYFITQNSGENTVQDALTFPSNGGTLFPAFFSSPWAIERYLEQNNLKEVLSDASVHPIAARDFLKQTRPAPLLFNPPVFTLAPDVIDQILQDKYDVVQPAESSASGESSTERPELQMDPSQCTQPMKLPPEELIREITSFLKYQSTILAAYIVQIEGDDETPKLAICCLCNIMQVEAYIDVEQDLLKILAESNTDNTVATLCMNYMPMDTFESIMNQFTPVYLDLSNMSDVEFDLFLDKLSVGRAPPPSPADRHAMLQRFQQEDVPIRAAYQLVYQISGYPAEGRVGTFLDAGADEEEEEIVRTPQRSLRECLRHGWGYLHELPSEMAEFCRSNLEPVYVASGDK